jgi:hypothetical protein
MLSVHTSIVLRAFSITEHHVPSYALIATNNVLEKRTLSRERERERERERKREEGRVIGHRYD